MSAVWTVERTRHRRFPFRIGIEQAGRLILAVRAQSAWPGPGQQIFCLREPSLDLDEPLEPIERVPIAHLGRVGRKLTIVLDRATRKRCEFLVVAKPAGESGGVREQIFFRTESGIRAHRSRTRVELLPAAVQLTVAVDSGERYPWRFPDATVRRRKLAVGDYALLDLERIAAVVERKTFDNLLTDFGALQALHHQLEDLGSCDTPALVIEAQYADFLGVSRGAGPPFTPCGFWPSWPRCIPSCPSFSPGTGSWRISGATGSSWPARRGEQAPSSSWFGRRCHATMPRPEHPRSMSGSGKPRSEGWLRSSRSGIWRLDSRMCRPPASSECWSSSGGRGWLPGWVWVVEPGG